MIGVDGSASSQLAYCEECPPWRELRADRDAALTAAAAHAEAVHADLERARALRQLATRATTRRQSSDVRTRPQD